MGADGPDSGYPKAVCDCILQPFSNSDPLVKRTLLISYLVALAFFGWGYAMVRFQVFPWQHLQPIEREIIEFIKGAPGEETKVTEKIVNDLNIRPSRQLYDYQASADRDYRRVPIDGLRERRQLPQGLEVLRDGTLILNEGYRGNGMQNVDFCGNFNWSALGAYHHIVALNEDDNTLWAFGPGDMMQLDLATGEVLKEIKLGDVHAANPDISIFTPRRSISGGRWLNDPIHKNDIEPLPARMAGAFPMFEPGDLLVTHRSTNLVFVMDPDDLAIKWWRSGIVRRPHDADWQPDGTITIYDNNMRETVEGNDGGLPESDVTRYSKITRIDPETYQTDILYDGNLDDFYSGARGVHQILPNGHILISSPHQGRVLEVDPQGETVFEFLNTYDEKEMLILAEARWFPPDFFDFDVTDPSICN